MELNQVVSDQGSGIKACSNDLSSQHIPELFHAQHELTKATSAPLSAQEGEFERNLAKSEEKLKKVLEKHGEQSENASKTAVTRNLSQYGYDVRRKRCKTVREAKNGKNPSSHRIRLSAMSLIFSFSTLLL